MNEQEAREHLQRVTRVQIQTTSICNGKCIICPYPESWQKNNPGRMTDEVFERILDQLAGIGATFSKICNYFENEPLTDPAIFERSELIYKKCNPGRVEISTNGLLLDAGNLDKLGRLFHGRPHDIWLSFHGTDKRRYEGVMGLPFEKGLANAIALLHLADEADLTVRIGCFGQGRTPELSHEYNTSKEEFLAFWKDVFEKNGIKKKPRLFFNTYHDRAGNIHRNNLRITDTVRESLEGFDCPRRYDWLHFLYTGEMLLCCMDYHRGTVFGNAAKDNLVDIFSSEAFEQLNSSVCGKIQSPANFICKHCISPGG